MPTPTDTSATSPTPLEEQLLLQIARSPRGSLASEATSFLLDLGILNPYERWYSSVEEFETAVRSVLVVDHADETRRLQPHVHVWIAGLNRWSVTVRDPRMILPLLARLAGVSLFFQRAFVECVPTVESAPTLDLEPTDEREEDRPELPDVPAAG